MRHYIFHYSNTSYVEQGTTMSDAFRRLCLRYPMLHRSNLLNAEIL